MKLLLISDTHGELAETEKIVEYYPKMDYYIHLGDIGFPLMNLHRFIMVKGNHDYETNLPMEHILQVEERKILCIHGNLFDEETLEEVLAMHSIESAHIMDICLRTLYEKLAAYAKHKDCDTLFFGHTHHQADVEVDGIHLINPGAVCFGTPHNGYAEIEIKAKDIQCILHDSEEIKAH